MYVHNCRSSKADLAVVALEHAALYVSLANAIACLVLHNMYSDRVRVGP